MEWYCTYLYDGMSVHKQLWVTLNVNTSLTEGGGLSHDVSKPV